MKSDAHWLLALFDLRDLHAYGGLLMLGYGGNLVFPGAGWAVAGAILLWLGVRR